MIDIASGQHRHRRDDADGVRRYPKDRFRTGLVYGDINYAGLRLLTCGGAFDRATGHYVDNIVVFAALARSYAAS